MGALQRSNAHLRRIQRRAGSNAPSPAPYQVLAARELVVIVQDVDAADVADWCLSVRKADAEGRRARTQADE